MASSNENPTDPNGQPAGDANYYWGATPNSGDVWGDERDGQNKEADEGINDEAREDAFLAMAETADMPIATMKGLAVRIPVLLRINGKSVSTPEPRDFATFGRCGSESLTFFWRIRYDAGLPPQIQLEVCHILGMTDRRYRHCSLFVTADMELDIAALNPEETKREIREKFKAPKDAEFPNGCTRVSIDTDRLNDSVDYERLEDMESPEFKERVETLRTALASQEDGRAQVNIYLNGNHTKEGSRYYTILELMRVLYKYRGTDWLQAWFSKSSVAKVLNKDTLIQPGEGKHKRPAIPAIPASSTFLDSNHYAVVTQYGLIDDYNFELARCKELAQLQFNCIYSAMPVFVKNEIPQKLLVVVKPGKAAALMPQRGEKFQMQISGLLRKKNEPYKYDIRKEMPGWLKGRVERAFNMAENDHTVDAQSEIEQLDIYGIDPEQNPDENVPKLEEIQAFLKETFELRRAGRVDDELKRITQFVEEKHKWLKIPTDATPEEEERISWFRAEQIDAPIPELNSKFRCFFVNVPMEPAVEAIGGPRRPANFQLTPPESNDKYAVWLQTKLEKASSTCTMRTLPAEKPVQQEIQAFAEAMHPRYTPIDELKPSERAQRIFNRLSTLESQSPEKTLFRDFPVLKQAVDGQAEPHIQAGFDRLDESQRAQWESMDGAEDNFVPMDGCVACGKSTFVCTVAAAIEHSDDSAKTLYICPNNARVDDIPAKAAQVQKAMGYEDAEVIHPLRVYSVPRELDAGTTKVTKGAAGREGTKPEERATDENIEALDHFLAVHVLAKVAEKHGQRPNVHKNFAKASLHVEVYNRYLRNPNADEFRALTIVLDSIAVGQDITIRQRVNAGVVLKEIYKDVLRSARSVASTASAARETVFRQAFEPTLVIQDDNARSHESTTVMMLTSFPSAQFFILVGDTRQLRPIVNSQEAMYKKDAMIAPFAPQRLISMLERLKLGRALIGRGLWYNHRQYAELANLPNKLFYGNKMKMGNKEQWPEFALTVDQLMREYVHPDKKPDCNRVLISINGSEERRVGTSYLVDVQIKYAVELAKKFIQDSRFVLPTGKPAKVSILCMYDATYVEVKMALRHADMDNVTFQTVGGIVEKRIDSRTVDGAQGSEAEVTIVLISRVNRPGFCGDPKRMNVLLTRSRYGEIILAEKSILGKDHAAIARAAKKPNTTYLYQMFSEMEDDGRMFSIQFCKRCSRSGHDEVDCPDPKPCHRCRRPGHSAEVCPEASCYKCGQKGHVKQVCGACDNCKQHGHKAKDCTEEKRPEQFPCRICSGIGHKAVDCPNKPKPVCYSCGEEGHARATCPKDKSTLWCTDCERHGHVAGLCAKNQPRTHPGHPT
ncbi:hypothetical protein DL769_008028 [Monosporascus sp. CRB-8-3]|nr:hypothetical protein DL769_008028 [Monosporascus sp. CRB-8-3]